MNLCIQVKHSLKIGWGPMSKLCWGDAGASFLLLVLEAALTEQCGYSLRDFLAQLGGGSGTGCCAPALFQGWHLNHQDAGVKGEFPLLQGFPSVDSRGCGCVKQADSLITFSSQIAWLIM